MLVRYMKSELQKTRNSLFYLWHFLLPILMVLVFGLYYTIREPFQKDAATLYYEVLSAAFPVGIALMTAMSVEWEEENHFQRFLGGPSRKICWFSKLGILYLSSCVTILIAVFLAQIFLVKDNSLGKGMMYVVLFAITNLMYYPIHLFLNLCVGRTVSVITALAGSVIGMLFLTGLGDGRWYLIPYAMNTRLCGYVSALLYGNVNPQTQILFISECRVGLLFLLLWVAAVWIMPAFWFRYWEGRNLPE